MGVFWGISVSRAAHRVANFPVEAWPPATEWTHIIAPVWAALLVNCFFIYFHSADVSSLLPVSLLSGSVSIRLQMVFPPGLVGGMVCEYCLLLMQDALADFYPALPYRLCFLLRKK